MSNDLGSFMKDTDIYLAHNYNINNMNKYCNI